MKQTKQKKKKILHTIKQGSGSILHWSFFFFFASGPGEQVKVQGIMDKDKYSAILKIKAKKKKNVRKLSLVRY